MKTQLINLPIIFTCVQDAVKPLTERVAMATLFDDIDDPCQPSLINSLLTNSRVGAVSGEHDLLVVFTGSLSIIDVLLSSGSNRSCYIAKSTMIIVHL